MVLGWGVSDHSGARLINDMPTKQVAVHKDRGMGLALTFLLIALVAFAAAIYIAAGTGRMSGKGPSISEELAPRDPQAFLDRQDYAKFDKYMQDRMIEIVEAITNDKRQETLWLPYLRFYAFNHEGLIPGVASKTLRGAIGGTAPVDCSLKQWRRRWRASHKQWNQLIVEQKLIRAHWARMLAWDPHWIRRRESKGWIGNQNYYAACMLMADRALDELAMDQSLVQTAGDWSRMGYPQVKRRLTYILDVVREGHSAGGAFAVDTGNSLGIWTCMEQARDLRSLAKCREGLSGASDQEGFMTYTEDRYAWNAMRIAAMSPATLTPDAIALLERLALKANYADFYTRFDYRPEHKLMKLFSKTSPGDKASEKLIEKVNAEFPEVNLNP